MAWGHANKRSVQCSVYALCRAGPIISVHAGVLPCRVSARSVFCNCWTHVFTCTRVSGNFSRPQAPKAKTRAAAAPPLKGVCCSVPRWKPHLLRRFQEALSQRVSCGKNRLLMLSWKGLQPHHLRLLPAVLALRTSLQQHQP